jgi:hypothetical protein
MKILSASVKTLSAILKIFLKPSLKSLFLLSECRLRLTKFRLRKIILFRENFIVNFSKHFRFLDNFQSVTVFTKTL